MFTRKFDRRVKIFLGTLVFSIVLGFSFGTYALWQGNMSKGYEPEQPIYFPHSVMAGKFEIPCLYCHTNAEKEAHATIPPVSRCMKCHKEIKPKNSEGLVKENVRQLLDYATRGEPIPWVKVYDLCDFVYFDHSRHLQPKTGLSCVDCHGHVEKMDRVVRVPTLKMGWCLDCHKQPPPPGSPPWQKTRAPIDCYTCHR